MKMQIDPSELRPLSNSLFGFARHEVRPLGKDNISLSLGEEPLHKTRSTIFTIVDAVFSYNVILSRPA